MKVNNIQTANSIAAGNSVSNRSFRGIGTTIGNANRWAMHHLETGGFFAEFCFMDLCGLVLPRVYQGFQRNKKELGHLNYKAGFEELIREATTGPSMFLIPIGAVILAGKALGKATQINFKFLNKFEEYFKNIGEKFATTDNKTTQKAFAGELFDKLFVQNKDRIVHPQNSMVKPLEEFKEEFVKRLTVENPSAPTPKSFIDRIKNWKAIRVQKNQQLGSFIDLVADINAAHFNKENTISVLKEGKGRALNAADLFLDARKYMEDVIPSAKLTFADITAKGETITKEVFDKIVTSITKTRHNGRELLCLGGTAALAAFLCIIPKLYQLSKKNPALNGFEQNNNKEVAKC